MSRGAKRPMQLLLCFFESKQSVNAILKLYLVNSISTTFAIALPSSQVDNADLSV